MAEAQWSRAGRLKYIVCSVYSAYRQYLVKLRAGHRGSCEGILDGSTGGRAGRGRSYAATLRQFLPRFGGSGVREARNHRKRQPRRSVHRGERMTASFQKISAKEWRYTRLGRFGRYLLREGYPSAKRLLSTPPNLGAVRCRFMPFSLPLISVEVRLNCPLKT